MSTHLYKIGYALIGAALVALTAHSAYQASSALHINQKLQAMAREKQQLEVSKSLLDQHIATQTALTPIQQQLASQYTPITTFMTAARHSTVALR